MRVPCPNCSTEYDVPDAALAGRSRKLRCERCQHAWRTPGPGSDAPITRTPPPPPAWAVPQARKPAAAPAARAEPPQPSMAPPPPQPPPVARVTPLPGAPPPAVVFPQPPVAVVSAPVARITTPPSPQSPLPFPGPAPAPAHEPAAPVWMPISEPDNLIHFPPPEARQFGKPVDESAQVEIVQAVAQEQRWQPLTAEPGDPGPAAPIPFPATSAYSAYESAPEDEALPAFLTAAGADETLMLTAPYATVGGDRFAELVYAARNNAIELEPEKPPAPPPVRTSNMKLFVSLVVAFLLALAFLEHAEIAHYIPATAPFFTSIGLK